jgi:hypothetical protein
LNKIETDIATRLNISLTQYKYLASKEIWLDSEEAKAMKAIDQIVYLQPDGAVLKNFLRHIEGGNQHLKNFDIKLEW